MFLRHTTDDENNVGTWARGHVGTWAPGHLSTWAPEHVGTSIGIPRWHCSIKSRNGGKEIRVKTKMR